MSASAIASVGANPVANVAAARRASGTKKSRAAVTVAALPKDNADGASIQLGRRGAVVGLMGREA